MESRVDICVVGSLNGGGALMPRHIVEGLTVGLLTHGLLNVDLSVLLSFSCLERIHSVVALR